MAQPSLFHVCLEVLIFRRLVLFGVLSCKFPIILRQIANEAASELRRFNTEFSENFYWFHCESLWKIRFPINPAYGLWAAIVSIVVTKMSSFDGIHNAYLDIKITNLRYMRGAFPLERFLVSDAHTGRQPDPKSRLPKFSRASIEQATIAWQQSEHKFPRS